MPECMWFHVVTSGRCRLEVDGAAAQVLQPGDFALVPHGEGHRLRSGPDAAAPIIYDIPHEFISDRYAVLRHGGPVWPCVGSAAEPARPIACSTDGGSTPTVTRDPVRGPERPERRTSSGTGANH